MQESISAYGDAGGSLPDGPSVIKHEGAEQRYFDELAGLFPQYGREDSAERWKLEEMVHELYESNGEAGLHFISSFKMLCRSTDELRQLFDLAGEICERWGSNGCDMVSAFYYNNLDLRKFKKSVFVFCNCPSDNIQTALEEFWWLMGLGGFNRLLDNPAMFQLFEGLMIQKGMGDCKLLAEIVGDAANPNLELARCCRELIFFGDYEAARAFRGIPGIESMETGARRDIVRNTVKMILDQDAEGCRNYLMERYPK